MPAFKPPKRTEASTLQRDGDGLIVLLLLLLARFIIVEGRIACLQSFAEKRKRRRHWNSDPAAYEMMMMTAKGEIYQPSSTDVPSVGIDGAAAAGEASGSLPLLENEGKTTLTSYNQDTSYELLHSMEEAHGRAEPGIDNGGNSSRERSAASPKSASINNSNISERIDDDEIASSTSASPALKAILASQRNERDKDISLLSPQPVTKKLLRSSASTSADPCSSNKKQQQRPQSLLFSPPPPSSASSSINSSNNNDPVNLSTSSLESIGKISDRDLLSPIAPSGNHENMRLSVATADADDGAAVVAAVVVDDGAALLSPQLRHKDPFLQSEEKNGTTTTAAAAARAGGFMEFSSGLRSPAQRATLRFDGEEYMNHEDDESSPPAPVSTPNKLGASDTGESSFFAVHETLLRSPCPTILEAEHEDESGSEPSNECARDEPELSAPTTARVEDVAAENYVEWQQPRDETQVIEDKDENNKSAAPSPSRVSNALSPLKSIRSDESRRSLNLIERLRRSSFLRKMGVPGDGPDEASLSLLDDDDDEQDSQVHANDESISIVDSFLSHSDTKNTKSKAVVPEVDAPLMKESDFLPPPPFEDSNPPPEQEDGSFESNSSLGSLDAGGSTDEADVRGYSHGENESVHGRRQLSVDNVHLQGGSLTASSSSNNESARAKQGIGASSMAFIEQLRGAALRRKMNLSRSRDSLAAKERKQREDIAASEAARLQTEELERQAAEALERKNRRNSLAAMPSSSYTFKARPVPQANGLLGTGGIAGVPKVEKKPTTTPISPYLGPRRQLRQQSQTSRDNHHNDESSKECRQVLSSNQSHFRARPLPKTTGPLGDAGQSGVPKVPKRQVTVPFSPLLGSRRKPPPKAVVQVEERSKLDDSIVDDRRRSSSNESHMSASSGQSLLGVAICNQKENNVERAVATATPTNVATTAFIPRSTARAKKRAQFEAERKEKEQQRKEKERRERNEQLKALRKELQKLRSDI